MPAMVLWTTLLFVSVQSLAFRSTEVTGRFGAPMAATQALPAVFKVLNWNVHKGMDTQFFSDLEIMAQDAQVVMLQEAVEHPGFTQRVSQATPSFQWILARAFVSTGESEFEGHSGVSTGSSAASVSEKVLISTVTEPLYNTPKSAIIAEYRVEGQQETLLTLNVHAINFVTAGTFKVHMQQLTDALKNHKGPIVATGDFNTWSGNRMSILLKLFGSLGLKRVPIENYYFSPMIEPYDHVFVRGLRVHKAEFFEDVESSDHMALKVELEVDSMPVLAQQAASSTQISQWQSRIPLTQSRAAYAVEAGVRVEGEGLQQTTDCALKAISGLKLTAAEFAQDQVLRFAVSSQSAWDGQTCKSKNLKCESEFTWLGPKDWDLRTRCSL